MQSIADLPNRIRTGHVVSVIDEQGEQTRGRLLEVSRSTLTISGADGVKQFPADRIAAIDRHGDPLWNGLAIGLGVGTAMALLADERVVPCSDGRPGVCRDAELGSRLGAIALFGAIGTGIDALVRGRTTVYRGPGPRSSRRLLISPSASPRGAAVTLTINF